MSKPVAPAGTPAGKSPSPRPHVPGRLSAYYLGGTFVLAVGIIFGMFVYRMVTRTRDRQAIPVDFQEKDPHRRH